VPTYPLRIATCWISRNYSGWRRNEILGLTWNDVDLAGGVVRLTPLRSKTKAGRVLPVSQPLRQVFQRRQRRRRSGEPHVFHRDGVPVRKWRTALRDACRKAKVPHRLLHNLYAHCRPQSDSRWCARTRRHAPDRSQDTSGVRSVQHRERTRALSSSNRRPMSSASSKLTAAFGRSATNGRGIAGPKHACMFDGGIAMRPAGKAHL